MKKILCDYEVVIITTDKFIEGKKILLRVFENKVAREKGRHIERVVKYDAAAGDLYITYKNKKYFYYQFMQH